jgi:hypothetical protein
MLRHEFLQHVLLLLLVGGRFPLPLHLLVVHHLLDHASGLAVQVAQLGVLGRDFLDVDLGRRRHDVWPPVRVGRLCERDYQVFGLGGGRARRQRPGAVFG